MSNTDGTPVVVYAARSQAEEPGKDSTGDQIAHILRRIESEGGRFVYGEPWADHASGYHGNRGPDLERAMRAAERAVAEHGRAELWVFKSERLARGSGRKDEARSVMEVYVECRRAGVELRSVEDDAFLTNPMLVGVADEMAHKYSQDLSAHVRRGLGSRAVKGLPHGTPGMGYTHSEASDEDRAAGRLTGGHWTVNPAEAATVRRIFADYTERGLSYSGVAKALNADLVPSRNGAKWSPAVIRKLLTSRHVLGEFRHRGEWMQGEHPAIIDLATWDAAQRIAEAGRKYAPNGRAGRIPNAHLFIRGSLRCGICGAAMMPRTNRRYPAEWYECRTHFETDGPDACPMPPIDRAAVEVAALSLFERVALDIEGTRAHIAAQLQARMTEAQTQADRAERDIAQKRAALARFDRDYEAGELGAANYERQVARVSEELAAAEAERDRLAANAQNLDATAANIDAEHETFRRLAELRVAVAERVNRATDDVGALRAAWGSVFASTWVMPDRDDQYGVTPVLRPEMVPGGWDDRDGYATGAPARRVPITLGINCTGTQVDDQIRTLRAYRDQTSVRGTAEQARTALAGQRYGWHHGSVAPNVNCGWVRGRGARRAAGIAGAVLTGGRQTTTDLRSSADRGPPAAPTQPQLTFARNTTTARRRRLRRARAGCAWPRSGPWSPVTGRSARRGAPRASSGPRGGLRLRGWRRGARGRRARARGRRSCGRGRPPSRRAGARVAARRRAGSARRPGAGQGRWRPRTRGGRAVRAGRGRRRARAAARPPAAARAAPPPRARRRGSARPR
jgi:DNA invertase Pin-like site-specific DNA recombinase